jgi:hypothetical protein
MTSKRFTDELKDEAVKQVSERGYGGKDMVSSLLDRRKGELYADPGPKPPRTA